MEDIVYDGVRTTSPKQLSLLLTENFKQWFQAKPEEKDRDWKSALENETVFRQLAQSRGIKKEHEHAVDALWKSIAKRPDTNKLQAFQEQVQKTPTEQKFLRQIEHASQDSAGGMSELTYSLLKDLPSLAKKRIYEALV